MAIYHRNTGIQPVDDNVMVICRYHCGHVSKEPFPAKDRLWGLHRPPKPFDIKTWRYANPAEDPLSSATNHSGVA